MKPRLRRDPESGLWVPQRRGILYAPHALAYGLGPRRGVVAGGGSPTNVRYFTPAQQNTVGVAFTYSVGSVSVGDVLIFGANVQVVGTLANPLSVTCNLSNTVTSRVVDSDATFGPYTVYDIIAANAGTQTITVTGAVGTNVGNIWGTQWTGGSPFAFGSATASNDAYTAGGGNGLDQQTADLVIGGNRLVVGFFGGTGATSTGSATQDVGWNGATQPTPVFDAVTDKLATASTIHAHVKYPSGFVYTGGVLLAYTY